MQPHQIPSLVGTPIQGMGSPSDSVQIVLTNFVHPVMMVRQSGDRADLNTSGMAMESTTSTMTTLTELCEPDNKLMNSYEMEDIAFYSGYESLINDSGHQDHVDNSKHAIFDVQSDLAEDIQNQLEPSTPPCVTEMMNSVLPFEQLLPPSEFSQKDPVSFPSPFLKLSPDLEKFVDEILQETRENEDAVPDSSQLDLNLLEHPSDPNTLGLLMQECGIMEEDARLFGMEMANTEDAVTITPQDINIPSRPVVTKPEGAVAIAPQVICAPPEPAVNHHDCVGPVRVRRERRASRKPAKFRDEKVELYAEEIIEESETNVVASVSETSTTVKDLSYEEKYLRNRKQNNLASKRCREKRKVKFEEMSKQLYELESKNMTLQKKVENLTSLRDEFKKFVKSFLYQGMMQNGDKKFS